MSDTTDPCRGLPDRIIDRRERRAIIPYSDSHWARLEAAGEAPARVQLGACRVGWWLSEIMQWAKDRPRAQPKDAAQQSPTDG